MKMKLLKGKCTIDKFVNVKGRIKFCLKGFEKNINKSGVLKVGISVFNSMGKCVYEKKNTLVSNPGESKISLTIPLPKLNAGECELKIEVMDLIAKQYDSFSKKITLSIPPGS